MHRAACWRRSRRDSTSRSGEKLIPLFGANGLGLDSIDALELVVSMEKTFGVGVPNSEVAGKALRTVNTIHDYILEKRAATSQASANS